MEDGQPVALVIEFLPGMFRIALPHEVKIVYGLKEDAPAA
jgi:hypothetical protein